MRSPCKRKDLLGNFGLDAREKCRQTSGYQHMPTSTEMLLKYSVFHFLFILLSLHFILFSLCDLRSYQLPRVDSLSHYTRCLFTVASSGYCGLNAIQCRCRNEKVMTSYPVSQSPACDTWLALCHIPVFVLNSDAKCSHLIKAACAWRASDCQ